MTPYLISMQDDLLWLIHNQHTRFHFTLTNNKKKLYDINYIHIIKLYFCQVLLSRRQWCSIPEVWHCYFVRAEFSGYLVILLHCYTVDHRFTQINQLYLFSLLTICFLPQAFLILTWCREPGHLATS